MQRQVRSDVGCIDPERYGLPARKAHDLSIALCHCRCCSWLARRGRGRSQVPPKDRPINIPRNPHRAIRAPAQPSSKKRANQRHPIIQLRLRARHPELIEEPMEIQKRRRELVQDEHRPVVVEDGAKAQAEDGEGADGVRQQARPEHVQVRGTEHKVPQEVAGREGLDEPAGARVAEDALGEGHAAALVIAPDDPEGEGVDEAGLHHRHDVDVPVDAGSAVEAGVGAGEEAGGEPWREAGVDQVVEEEGEEDFVDVEGERGEVEVVGDGCYGLQEELGRWEWEWVPHLFVRRRKEERNAGVEFFRVVVRATRA